MCEVLHGNRMIAVILCANQAGKRLRLCPACKRLLQAMLDIPVSGFDHAGSHIMRGLKAQLGARLVDVGQ